MKEFWNVIQMVFTAVGGWLGYFLGGNDGLLIALLLLIVLVAEDVLVGHANLAALEPLVDTPFHILGNAAAFFLRERSEERKHQFSVLGKRMDP